MIPYFRLETLYLGPIPIHIWGLMVSLGIFIAILLAAREAGQKGLDKNKIWDAAFGMVIAAFVGARLMHVFGYHWEVYSQNWSEILKFWHGGLSATGGIIGAMAYFAFFVRQRKIDFWLYGDAIAWGFPAGYAIGRLGCFFVHDHPGTLSHFILAVKYPGGSRHDLGLYLSLSAAVMFLVMLALKKWKSRAGWPTGFFTAVFFVWYGATRLLLDFLRAYDLPITDTRYYGLTPAQYFGIILIVIGGYKLIKLSYEPKKPKP